MTVDPSAAFALFFKNHTGPVFRALLAGTLNRAAAEDATAEPYARAFAHWDTIAVHPKPRAWVLRVAWNCYRSSWRKWESRWSADQPEVPPLAPEPWSDPDLVAALRTFVSAIESLPNFRGPVEALGGWLFQIARHDLYDHRRKQSHSRTEPLEDQLTHPALNRLSPREREVLASFALEYELTADPDGREPLAMETLEEADVMAAL